MCDYFDPRPLRYALIWLNTIKDVWSNCQIKPADVELFRLRSWAVVVHLLIRVYVQIRIGLPCSKTKLFAALLNNRVLGVEMVDD
jgi:hypothetical protein